MNPYSKARGWKPHYNESEQPEENVLLMVEQVVLDTRQSLPKEFSNKIENVALIVTDWPTQEQVRLLNLHPGYLLFGLYQGIPRPQKPFTNYLHPDKITIFSGPIMAITRSWSEMKEKIKNTTLHEI